MVSAYSRGNNAVYNNHGINIKLLYENEPLESMLDCLLTPFLLYELPVYKKQTEHFI